MEYTLLFRTDIWKRCQYYDVDTVIILYPSRFFFKSWQVRVTTNTVLPACLCFSIYFFVCVGMCAHNCIASQFILWDTFIFTMRSEEGWKDPYLSKYVYQHCFSTLCFISIELHFISFKVSLSNHTGVIT